MIQVGEVNMLILGFGVLIVTLAYQKRIIRIPSWQVLISGFYFLLSGWIFTVLESFFWEESLNYLEHLCYACSSILMAIWCWRIVFVSKKEAH